MSDTNGLPPFPWGPEEIESIVPHRAPMRLIDGIGELEPGENAHGWKDITEQDCEGHFPKLPIYPGVKIVEGAAQVGAVALLSVPENRGKVALFRGIDKVTFRGQVKPGDVLQYDVKLTDQRHGMGRGEFKAYTHDLSRPVASGELRFAIGEMPQ